MYFDRNKKYIINKKPIVKKPIVKKPVVKKPIVKKPIVKKPIVKKPINKPQEVKSIPKVKPTVKRIIKPITTVKPIVNKKPFVKKIVRPVVDERLLNIPFLKHRIKKKDIIIYDKKTKSDTRNAGYNLGDLLNIPALSGGWSYTTHMGKNRMNLLGKVYNDSILSYYCENRQDTDLVPDIDLINKSVLNFIANNEETYKSILELVKDNSICCVHVRCGDQCTELEYINKIVKLSKKFKTIILLSGVHLDEFFKKNRDKIDNIFNTLNSILNKNNNIYVYLNSADVHLSIMKNASNLLLHKGGFSTLGSIVSTGKLFVTNKFGARNASLWKKLVNKPYTLI
jgi:hypothetical protein